MPGGCRETTPCVLAGSKYSVDSCASCAFVVDLKVNRTVCPQWTTTRQQKQTTATSLCHTISTKKDGQATAWKHPRLNPPQKKRRYLPLNVHAQSDDTIKNSPNPQEYARKAPPTASRCNDPAFPACVHMAGQYDIGSTVPGPAGSLPTRIFSFRTCGCTMTWTTHSSVSREMNSRPKAKIHDLTVMAAVVRATILRLS
ncbi:uncharacterized protein LOC112553424 [Pomacea canaliculata]|uniref:uncharacterized protein LOC112553424 n=1 Tax=Pomacea canaliculata TaxID=400727 RepID=UPI000D73B01D|nr:uncharacterized protein LOC112553424 [Pomacea canaliculata]